MKGKNLIIMGLPALAAGIALIITYKGISSTGVVITGGILFILAGIFNVVAAGYERRRAERAGSRGHGMISAAVNLLACAGAVILGVCMLIFKDTFVTLIPFIFGVLIAFSAFYQVYLLAYGTRPVMLPGWLYIVPLALAGTAVYLFLQKPEVDDTVIMLTTGIALSFFGLSTVAEGMALGRIRRRTIHDAGKAAKAPAEVHDTVGTGAAAVEPSGHPDTAPRPEPLDPDTE